MKRITLREDSFEDYVDKSEATLFEDGYVILLGQVKLGDKKAETKIFILRDEEAKKLAEAILENLA